MILTEHEMAMLNQFCLPLRSAGRWLTHGQPPAIGPFDTHVAWHDYRELAASRPAAALCGIRLGLACLRRFHAEICDTAYPFSWAMCCEIEDSWLFAARTPPEVLFFSGDDDAVGKYIEGALEHCVCVGQPGLLPESLHLDETDVCWFIRPPVSIDDRFFVDVWRMSPALSAWLERHPPPVSQEYHQVLKRCLHVLNELAARDSR